MTLSGYDWRAAVDAARQRLHDKGFPLPKKPNTPLSELDMPEDMENVTVMDLTNLKLRLSRWYAFATASLAFARAEYSAAHEALEVQLGEKMFQLKKTTSGQISKELLKGEILMKNDDLADLWREGQALEQRMLTLSGLVDSLQIEVNELQSEQIRRYAARKMEEGDSR